MFSGRQLIRELQRVRQDVDAVGERLDKYEQNIERLDKCVERLEEMLSQWAGTRIAPEPGAPPVADFVSVLNSLFGKGLEASLGPVIARLIEVIGPIVSLAKTLQTTERGSMRIDFSKISKEGVVSLLLIGLMISVMEDKLREGVESIIEIARPYRGLAEALLKFSGNSFAGGYHSDSSSSTSDQQNHSGDIISLTTALLN